MNESVEKLQVLKNILRDMGSALVAFSGGTDSSFLLKMAADVLGGRVLAVTAESEIHPGFERRDASELAKELGIRHLVVHSGDLENECFLSNTPERCYHCKKALFSSLKQMAIEEGIAYVADGTNADDTKDFRPGTQALAELGIRSPLKEAGMTKEDIRHLSRQAGLQTWDRPAMACLASRIPYGTRITPEALKRIAAAEAFLQGMGFRQVRVRDHETVARIEVPLDQIQMAMDKTKSASIVSKLKKLGYRYIALDMEGYRTGSLNEVLKGHGQGKH
ncbi:ATP-dependent sacrificial sulfur transferase LarE [bacterium]|nr:ATP-dependent sacrificial sulfur transferase LarE [bacterium]